jgi:glycosyltransferase involved in cell wall biosynthesis
MRIAIVNTLPVPSGQASVNRFLGYAQGLVKCGDDVTCISSAKPIGEQKGDINGVHYINYGEGGRFYLFKSLQKIRALLQREKYDIVIVVCNSLLMLYPLYRSCKKVGTKLLMEKSEFPFALMRDGQEIKSGWRKIYGNWWDRIVCNVLDGMIVMTTPLVNYYTPKLKPHSRIVHIPMTVDMSRFQIEKNKSAYGDYIAYCGNMTTNKDGIENLLEAFKEVEAKYKEIKLVLIGGCSTEKRLCELKDYAKALGLNNVVFHGRVPREEMPELLKNAAMLALARPTSTQATYGFPTKLGEYLSTGNPVVVTAVGDIPLYLNNDNSYIVKADDNYAFGQRMIEVLSDYKHALEVGAKGKELAKNVFNAEVQAVVLHEWLNGYNKAKV